MQAPNAGVNMHLAGYRYGTGLLSNVPAVLSIFDQETAIGLDTHSRSGRKERCADGKHLGALRVL